MASLRDALQEEAKKYGFDTNNDRNILLFGLLRTQFQLRGKPEFDEPKSEE